MVQQGKDSQGGENYSISLVISPVKNCRVTYKQR